ncbi:MAG: HAMP domain-containing sensor histidine kinase [bacterium]
MLLNKIKKTKLSFRYYLAIVIFIIIFVFSTLLLILFQFLVINKSYSSVYIDDNIQDTQIIVEKAKNAEIQTFYSSLFWVLLIVALIGAILAYAISYRIAMPIEEMLYSLTDAYRRGIPYVRHFDEKYNEIEEISQLVEDMTNRYINTLDLQNKFLQDISHELKTPLAAIKSTSDLIVLNENPGIEDYKYFYQTVQIMNERLINLVNQLTLSNKSYAELVDEENVNISNIIRDIVQTLVPMASYKNIKIDSDIEQNIIINGSGKYLAIAITNIIENAIKYSINESSIVLISLKKYKNKSVLRVKDYGIGISESDINNIFTRFYRGSNVINIDGSGLGLSISKRIINAHGGKIFIYSRLGDGSEVKVVF